MPSVGEDAVIRILDKERQEQFTELRLDILGSRARVAPVPEASPSLRHGARNRADQRQDDDATRSSKSSRSKTRSSRSKTRSSIS
jgi:hypothetical protein